MSAIQRVRLYFEQGHERSVKAKKNIFAALILKIVGIATGFLTFTISLSYLDATYFGIFLTMSSLVGWFIEMDVGIGNGLKNKLGEALADGDEEKAKGYISTAYFYVAAIFSGVSILLMVISYFLPWADWLGADPALSREMSWLAVFMFGALAIRFVANLIYQVFFAMQRSAIVDSFMLVGKLLFLLIALLFLFFAGRSLLLFGAAQAFTFAIVPLVIGIFYFNGPFKSYKPSLKTVDKSLFKDLFSLGFQFFLIKISMVIIYQTNNILIARFASLDAVPQYEAANKYLFIFVTLFNIFTNQLWPANVEAFRKGDFNWMKRNLKKLTRIWLGTVVIGLLMVVVSPFFFQLWLQGKVHVPMLLTLAVALSISTTTWVNLFNMVINGTGKVKLQMFGWLLACLLNIPLSILFARYFEWGAIGVVVGTMASLIPLVILSPIQVRKVLSQKARGIWAA